MENAVHSAIVSFIWNIADDCLRDVYVRGKYRDVILPMTVIRRLDAMLEDTKDSVLKMKEMLDKSGIANQDGPLRKASGQAFYNSSPFLLKDLTSRGNNQTLRADFEAYLDGFSPNVQEILAKFKFRNQLDTLVEADILGDVIEKFTSKDINLSPRPVYADDSQTFIRLPALDNHGMGTVFEELIRKFNEDNNEEAGEHWTPRDVVELMADLIFVPVADKITDNTYACYDGACGTGGMLTVADKRLQELAAKAGKNVSIQLFGQEVNPETFAICKADMLLKGDGAQADNISYGSTLSLDGNATMKFDFMLSNPPYGKSWKTDKEKLETDEEGKGKKKVILDSRFHVYLPDQTELTMAPRSSDGQLLFLLNNVAKMKQDTQLGSRIAEVHNGSSLFTGDAGSGESNARRYLIENDLVEAIIALPENMFYNTGIGTFIWVLSNRKEERRRGKIQLIDATDLKEPLRKNMGKKNCEFTSAIREQIMQSFLNFEESDISKIFPNEEFGFWNITVERPLRQKVTVNDETLGKMLKMFKYRGVDIYHEDDTPEVAPADVLAYMERHPNVRTIKMPKTFGELAFEKLAETMMDVLKSMRREEPYMGYNAFIDAFYANPQIKMTRFKKFEDFMWPLIEKDSEAEIVYKKGKPIPDVELRDTEIVPFRYAGGIEGFMQQEVLPYADDAWVDESSTKIGYELSFTKYFYKPTELPTMPELMNNLQELEKKAEGMMNELMEGLDV